MHLHFSFLYDGQFTEAHGKSLSGWYIEETSHYNGTMSKDGQVVAADAEKSSANLITK